MYPLGRHRPPHALGDNVAALDPPPRDRPRRGRGADGGPDGARSRRDDRGRSRGPVRVRARLQPRHRRPGPGAVHRGRGDRGAAPGRRDQGLPILAIAQADDLEERIALLEAGADDVITKPFDQVELEARVEALSLRFQRSKERSALVAVERDRRPTRPADRVGVQPQGRRRARRPSRPTSRCSRPRRNPGGTLLIDLDLSFGQVASHLNLEPKQTPAGARPRRRGAARARAVPHLHDPPPERHPGPRRAAGAGVRVAHRRRARSSSCSSGRSRRTTS